MGQGTKIKEIVVSGQYNRLVKDSITSVDTVVHSEQTIEEAIAILRKKHIDSNILYFYVLDKEERLLGVVSARDLLLKESHLRICDIMQQSVISLREDHTLAEAMHLLQTHHLLAIPIVEENGRFLGIIGVSHYFEESLDVASSKQRMQIFQMLGFFIDEDTPSSTLQSYRIRMPWIFCNMVGGLACAVISAVFETVLTHVIILAMFIPLVLSLSESISMQAMTQSVNNPPPKGFGLLRMLSGTFGQSKLFSLLAITSGVVVGGISIFWGDGLGPPMVICLSIFISIVITALIGAAIPRLLHYYRLDPKVASGPLVLSLADIITTSIYLSLATWLLL